MRFLLYGINYLPELTGIGKYTGEMAEWLAERGHDVTVVTAFPYYPSWKVSPEYKATRFSVEKRSGVRVIRCPIWVPSNPSGLKRILHLASFALSSCIPLLWTSIRAKPDVIWTVEPSLFHVTVARLATLISGSKSWLHVQDFEVDAAFELGLLRGNRARNAALRVERSLMTGFSRISTISERMMQKLEEKRVPAERRVLFVNWVDCDSIRPVSPANSLRAELGIGDTDVVLLYSGNMGEKQGVETLARLGHRLRGKAGIRLILCGDGSGRKRLEQEISGLDSIHLLPLQPLEKLNALLNTADIHLLPQKAEAADLVLPSKLGGMLASGKPVVAMAASGTELHRIVSRCGRVAAPGDDEAFVEAIFGLAVASDLRAEMGEAARRYALKHLARDSVLAEFEFEAQSLMGRSSKVEI